MKTNLKAPGDEAKKGGEKKHEGSDLTFRASISFPSDLYKTLDKIAKHKKVSVAWVVRDAAEKYVVDRTLADGEQTPRT